MEQPKGPGLTSEADDDDDTLGSLIKYGEQLKHFRTLSEPESDIVAKH